MPTPTPTRVEPTESLVKETAQAPDPWAGMTEDELEKIRDQAFTEAWRIEDQPPGPKYYGEMAHQPFDPEIGPRGTEEELLQEIHFVMDTMLNYLMQRDRDDELFKEALARMRGRLSTDYRDSCDEVTIHSWLEYEFEYTLYQAGKDTVEPAYYRDHGTYAVEIKRANGKEAIVGITVLVDGAEPLEETRTPVGKWIYVEGLEPGTNRWVMEPEVIRGATCTPGK